MRVGISLKLQVLAGGRIIVPGTEPSTTVTSTTLEAQLRGNGMPQIAVVQLEDVLSAIPGTRVELLENQGAPVQKLLVFPERDIDEGQLDWYGMLRELARPATADEVDELIIKQCDAMDNWDHLYGS